MPNFKAATLIARHAIRHVWYQVLTRLGYAYYFLHFRAIVDVRRSDWGDATSKLRVPAIAGLRKRFHGHRLGCEWDPDRLARVCSGQRRQPRGRWGRCVLLGLAEGPQEIAGKANILARNA
jgi:hypothetical protein